MSKTESIDQITLGAVIMLSGAADPSAGGGVTAAVGSMYLRTDGTIWSKTGAGATAWVQNYPSGSLPTTASNPSTAGLAGAVGDAVIYLNGTSSDLYIKMSSTATDWIPVGIGSPEGIYFGDGSDGAATISADTDEAGARGDVCYTNLTIDATKVYRPQSRKIYVNDTLTINGTIRQNGAVGLNGDGTSGAKAGGAGGGASSQPIVDGTAGGTGGTGAGGNGVTETQANISATNGIGGAGGAATGAGGAGGTNTGWTSAYGSPRGGPLFGFYQPQQAALYGTTGAGTGGGGGGGGGAGSNGPSGGGGGGNIVIIARRIVFGASGVIESKGGAGGSGGTSANAGGAGGGGGGNIFVLCRQLEGTQTLTVTGGVKGTKTGTGADGNNGNDGLALLRFI